MEWLKQQDESVQDLIISLGRKMFEFQNLKTTPKSVKTIQYSNILEYVINLINKELKGIEIISKNTNTLIITIGQTTIFLPGQIWNQILDEKKHKKKELDDETWHWRRGGRHSRGARREGKGG